MRRTVCIIEKGAVSNQLGVESAVVRMVDLFGHQPVKPRADLAHRMSRIDGERGFGGKGGLYRDRVNQE